MTTPHIRRPQAIFTAARFGGLAITAITAALLLGCTAVPWSAGPSPSVKMNELGLPDYHSGVVPTRSHVRHEAKQHRLPDEYVAEARIGLSAIEHDLAAARAREVEKDATLREGLARISARRSEAEASERASLAEADKIREHYTSKQNQLWAGIASRERTLGSTVEKNAAMIEALGKEREMVLADLSSRAWNEYQQALAQIQQFQSVRGATFEEGQAALAEMRESFQATRSRAAATVSRLRTEAESVRNQSNARADEIQTRIKTVRQHAQADAARLRTQAESLLKDAAARHKEMVARAEALTEQASQEQYDLKINAAHTEFRKAKAEHERLMSRAESTRDRASAEIERLQGEAEQIAFLADANYRHGASDLKAWRKGELAEVSKLRSQADRTEKESRAEFVKHEAAARANAIRETALHTSELAAQEMKKIIAEAEHEAARVRTQILTELAKRQRQNSVEFTGKTAPAATVGANQPANLHDVPSIPTVEPVTPVIEPEHIADFRTSLAQVMNMRAKADAREMALNATFDESRSRIEAVRAQFQAVSAEKIAIAEAMSVQAAAQFADLTTQASSVLSLAEATFERSITEADAFRKEKMAEAAELQAEAIAVRELGAAHSELLLAESNVVANHGESEARALEAALDATRRRGEAEYTRLWVEADSVEKANQALAMQINAQIAAAERVLEAELSKQDRAIASAASIAEANYSESLVHADVFARKTDVEIDRLRAQNDLHQAIASAEIDHLRNLTFSTVLKADATVGRVLANARADREQAEAVADVLAANVRTEHDMARAETVAQSRAAEAREHAVRATFDARIVQVQSERVRELTDLYRDDFFRRTNLETSLAEAEAARSEMNQRFAALKTEQQQLQRTARQNWDSRLASMQQRPTTPQPNRELGLPGDLEQITHVPTDR